jgi:hypothetical protein
MSLVNKEINHNFKGSFVTVSVAKIYGLSGLTMIWLVTESAHSHEWIATVGSNWALVSFGTNVLDMVFT